MWNLENLRWLILREHHYIVFLCNILCMYLILDGVFDLGNNNLQGSISESISSLSSLRTLDLGMLLVVGSNTFFFREHNLTQYYIFVPSENNKFIGSFPTIQLGDEWWTECRVGGNCFQNFENALTSDCDVSNNCV